MPASEQAYGFGTPFQAQIDYLRQKLNLPTEKWDDITGRAHDRAFVVAGAAKADLLADLHQLINQRATDGKGLEAFRKDFKAIVATRGWTGWTGEGTQEGEAWRTRVIYQTNMATSYAAGRHAQMSDPEVLKLHPYWRYIHSEGALHPRPLHLSWHGLTLPADHEFWSSHFAPNGWGCQCRITSVTRREGEASARAGLGEPPDDWQTINPKTGAPLGIDKGFDYAPGATWHPNLDKYPFELARDVVSANAKDGVLERWLENIDARAKDELVKPAHAGARPEAASAAIRKTLSAGERVPVAVTNAKGLQALQIAQDAKTASGYTTQTVWLSDDTAIKQALHRTGQDLPLNGYARLQTVLELAMYVEHSGDLKLVYYHDGADIAVAVVKTTADRKEIYLVSMRRSNQKELDKAIKSGRAVKWE